ncbi:MAG: hypothetical protein JWN33_654 [Candidatus Saccharibacteria bacterium]|nr:hypothetical protein [Candidatus Saccharibacteria bacterium]
MLPLLLLLFLSIVAALIWNLIQSYRVGALVPEVVGGVVRTLDRALTSTQAQPSPTSNNSKSPAKTTTSGNSSSKTPATDSATPSTSETVIYEPIEINPESGEVLAMATFRPSVLSQASQNSDNTNSNVAYAFETGSRATSSMPLISSSEEGWQLFGIAWYWWAISGSLVCLGIWFRAQFKRISLLKKTSS